MNVPAVILAGGRAARMGGGDKCLLEFGGTAILTRILTSLVPQTAGVLLNANGDPSRFAAFDVPVRADVLPGFEGPLAGLLTGMVWAHERHPRATHIVSVAGDMPFLPRDLVARLQDARAQKRAKIAIACDGERLHPVIGLWPVNLATNLERTLRETGIRALHRWLETFDAAACCFARSALLNINTWSDAQSAGCAIRENAGITQSAQRAG